MRVFGRAGNGAVGPYVSVDGGEMAKFGPIGEPNADGERNEGTRIRPGLWERFSRRSSGPFQWDRVCGGGCQRWRAGRQTEPVQNFPGGIRGVNRGENP